MFLKNLIQSVNAKIYSLKIKKALQNGQSVKLHLGCGRNYKNGWINIDNNSYNDISKLDLNFDLRNNLPFPDNSADFIYTEHFLEHLTVQEAVSFLRNIKRILKPEGIIRIAMPDLKTIVGQYSNPEWTKEYTFLGEAKTNAEQMNLFFSSWGHKYLYDFEELERRLKEAGFTKISKCHIYESSHPELKNTESRGDSLLVAEAEK